MRSVSLGLFLSLFASVLFGAVDASHAHAQDDRPIYVGFGLGPSIGLGGGGASFKLEQSVGVHVLEVGDHPGLFVGGALAESFAGGATLLQAGARVGFDAHVFESRTLTLLATPIVTLGASVSMFDSGEGGRQTNGAFNMGFGGELRLLVADEKVSVWVRPIGIDLHIRSGVAATYDLLVGANYNF